MTTDLAVAVLTVEDMSARLGHSADWWQRRAAAKTVPHHRDGRRIWFTDDDVTAYLEQTAISPTDPLKSQTDRSRGASKRGTR
jgi:excisionase family DNA binding protein